MLNPKPQGTPVKCSVCGWTMNTRSTAKRVTCSSCQHKNVNPLYVAIPKNLDNTEEYLNRKHPMMFNR